VEEMSEKQVAAEEGQVGSKEQQRETTQHWLQPATLPVA